MKNYANVSDNQMKEQLRGEMTSMQLDLEEMIGKGGRRGTISGGKRSPDNSIAARGKSAISVVSSIKNEKNPRADSPAIRKSII